MLGWALRDARDTADGDDESTIEIAARLVAPLALTDDDSPDPASDLMGRYDGLFEDLDFETLNDPELDGIDSSEHGRELRMESLRPADCSSLRQRESLRRATGKPQARHFGALVHAMVIVALLRVNGLQDPEDCEARRSGSPGGVPQRVSETR